MKQFNLISNKIYSQITHVSVSEPSNQEIITIWIYEMEI